MAKAHLGTVPRFEITCDKANIKTLDYGFDYDNSGVRGSLKYVTNFYSNAGAGAAYASQLRNLIATGPGTSLQSSGNIITDNDVYLENVVCFEAYIEYKGMTSSGLAANEDRYIESRIEPAPYYIPGVYVGLDEDDTQASYPPSGCVLNQKIYFKNSVAAFKSNPSDPQSLPRCAKKDGIIIPFYLNLEDKDNPTTENAPSGTVVTRSSAVANQYIYDILIPYSLEGVLGVRLTPRRDATYALNFGTLIASSNYPVINDAIGVMFSIHIGDKNGLQPAETAFEGVWVVLEAHN